MTPTPQGPPPAFWDELHARLPHVRVAIARPTPEPDPPSFVADDLPDISATLVQALAWLWRRVLPDVAAPGHAAVDVRPPGFDASDEQGIVTARASSRGYVPIPDRADTASAALATLGWAITRDATDGSARIRAAADHLRLGILVTPAMMTATLHDERGIRLSGGLLGEPATRHPWPDLDG